MSTEALDGMINKIGDFLEIRAHELPWDAIKNAAAEIKQNQDIKRFFIKGSPDSADSISLLLDAAKDNKLDILNFTRTTIDEPQARAIASALQQQPQLNCLYFDNVSITPEATNILASALHHNAGLENLLFEQCQLGDAGAKVLADALPTCTKLKEVRLHDCDIGDEGAQALAQSVPLCRKLDAINLTNNRIGDEGAVAFANALAKEPSLSTLLLARNQFGSAGFRALAQSLQDNKTLNSLNVAFSSAEDLQISDLQMLAEIVPLGNIATLDLSHEGLNNGHKQKLIETALKGESKQLIGLSLDTFRGQNFLSSHQKLFNFCNQNYKCASEAYHKLKTNDDISQLAIADLTRAASRLPAMKAVMRAHKRAGLAEFKAKIIEAVNTAYTDLGEPHSLGDFAAANRHGITYLDNPDCWRKIDIHLNEMQALGTPLTKDFLMQPNRDGDSFLSGAVYSGELKNTLAALGQYGERLGEKELLESEKPSPLLQAIIDEGELPALFSRENWAGQTPQALRRVYNALPEEAQMQIGNYHALLAEVSRSAVNAVANSGHSR